MTAFFARVWQRWPWGELRTVWSSPSRDPTVMVRDGDVLEHEIWVRRPATGERWCLVKMICATTPGYYDGKTG